MNKLIAIVGMCGSGKSIASDYFENLGYQKVYFGGVTMAKLKEAGLEVNPENERAMREGLRKEYGMAAYAIILLPKIEELLSKGNVILDGLYSWDDLKVIAIVVNKDKRYARLANREIRPFNNEEAKDRDITEIENLAKAGPIAFADYYILNDENIEEYYKNLDDITKLISEED